MMSVVEFFSQPVWHRLSLTLAHFLWQGLAMAVLACAAVRLLKLKRGNRCYAAYLLAFALMGACPAFTFATLDADAEPAGSMAVPIPIAASSEPGLHPMLQGPPYQLTEPPPSITVTHEVPLREKLYRVWQTVLPWMLLCWMGGVLILSVRLSLGFIGICRWRRGLEPVAEGLQARVALLAERLSLPGFSRVFTSRHAQEAVAVGYLRPMVLLPAALLTRMPPEMLEAVIAHELAHIRRFDLWVNLAQRVVETLLFYHPAVWWLSHRLRAEREFCCDDMAVKATGERLTYASALESAGRLRLAMNRPALAAGFGHDRKPLLSRVRHILGLPTAPSERHSWVAGAITVALLAVLAIPTVEALTASENRGNAEESREPRLVARTFNSDVEMGIDVQTGPRSDLVFEQTYWEHETERVGRTPSAAPLQIPACQMWWVHPSDPVKDWDLLVREIDQKKIPGLGLSQATDLDLSRLTGLTELRGLLLRSGQVTNEGLASLKNLTGLQWLDLSETGITDTGLAPLQDLRELRGLNLSKTHITGAGLIFLKGLTKLQCLYLSNDAITNADTEHLKGFTALRRLDLSRTQITDAGLVQLGGLTGLQMLDLSTTWVTGGGLAHLQGMTQLQELILRGSAVAEQPLQPLGNLTSLQALDLLLTRVTDADLAYLENLTGLHRLDLSHTRITDAGLIHLKGLTALQHLQLGGNAITDAGLEHLTGLTQLRRLDLSETQLTDAGLERLKALTELEQLDLSGSKITGPGLAHLEGLTKLQSLSLNGTPITGTGLGHLKTLTELRFLTLRESQITDGGLAYLEGMTKLQSLELTGTQITDAGLTHLEGMTGLEGLGLSRGRITDQGLEHLKNLPNLKQVNFDGHPTPSSALFSTGGAEKASPIQEANPTDIGATARNDALPSGWSLDYDDGLRAGGSTTWVSGMATDLASLEGIPMNMDTSDTSRENERYEFEVCSPKGERVGTIDIRTNRRDTSTSRITLKPGKYVLRYTRRFGTPGDNFRAYSGPFPVDLPQPGMYKLRFPPKLSNAEINGVLGGCYALNFERINDGYDLAGFIYLDPRLSKPYAINGLPAGTYRLSAVTQDDHGNNLVSQAQATVRAGEKLTVNIAPPLRGDCSLRGAIAGRPGTYWTPTRMPQQTERQWFVLIRTRGSGPVEQTNAYEAQTMDSRYVIRGGNIVQETADRASYSIRDIAPGEYTVTAIEHPWFEGVPIERQQSKLLTLRLGETATLDFDLGDPPVGLAALPPLDRIGHGDQVARTTGKRLLICFFDVTQRRSRNRLLELNERGPSLAAQNVQVLAVQACDVQTGTLDKWLKQNNIAFPVSRMAALGDDLRAAWGIKILPWLIATDDRHVVAAEGIELADLGEAIPR